MPSMAASCCRVWSSCCCSCAFTSSSPPELLTTRELAAFCESESISALACSSAPFACTRAWSCQECLIRPVQQAWSSSVRSDSSIRWSSANRSIGSAGCWQWEASSACTVISKASKVTHLAGFEQLVPQLSILMLCTLRHCKHLSKSTRSSSLFIGSFKPAPGRTPNSGPRSPIFPSCPIGIITHAQVSAPSHLWPPISPSAAQAPWPARPPGPAWLLSHSS